MLLLFLQGNRLWAQKNNDILAYINIYKEISISEMQRTGIPASIILAQGIHETEAGTSELVRKSNNHFGIKCKENWTGSVVYHDDDAQGECFRSYSSAFDSYKDHSDFLKSSSRYQFLFKLDPMNYAGWAYGLKKAGYATNSKYSQILIRLIQDYNLQQYTLIAMGRIGPSDELPPVPQLIKANLSVDSVAGPSDAVVIGMPPAPDYPEGIFAINNAKVVFARAGKSLLSIADQYEVSLPHIIDFNELKGEEVLVKDQLVFLQRKRKTGANEFHTVLPGESLYDISQAEGIRYESLLELNQLSGMETPAIGSKLSLQKMAASKPALAKLGTGSVMHEPEPAKKDTVAEGMPPIMHIVQTNETLYSISKKYGVDVEKIQEWNKLDSMSLRTGQELIIYKN